MFFDLEEIFFSAERTRANPSLRRIAYGIRRTQTSEPLNACAQLSLIRA